VQAGGGRVYKVPVLEKIDFETVASQG